MMGFAPFNPSYSAFEPFRRTPMHDLRWIRENPDAFDRGLLRRGLPARAEEVLAIDRQWRALETEAQESQATRNRLSREIGAAKAHVSLTHSGNLAIAQVILEGDSER